MRNKTLALLAFAASLISTVVLAGAPQPQNGFVVAGPDGKPFRSSGYTVTHVATGQYEVDTIPNIHPCAYSVTAGSGDTTVPPISIATAVGKRGNHTAIMVATYDQTGTLADQGFHLIVRCVNAQTDGAAVVNSDGTLARGISVSSAARLDTGSYTVTFSNGSLSTTCAYTASIGLSATTGVSTAGFINVSAVSGGTIAVRTYDPHGNAADLGFHVFAACNL